MARRSFCLSFYSQLDGNANSPVLLLLKPPPKNLPQEHPVHDVSVQSFNSPSELTMWFCTERSFRLIFKQIRLTAFRDNQVMTARSDDKASFKELYPAHCSSHTCNSLQ